MQEIIALQRWLYGGMASGLGDVAQGNAWAIAAAMTTAMLIATLFRSRLLKFLTRTESLRGGLGRVFEIGGAVAVLLFGLWTLYGALGA